MSGQTVIPTVTFRVVREFTKGTLVGIVHPSNMTFVSVKRADVWFKGVSANKNLDYKVIGFYEVAADDVPVFVQAEPTN